MFSISEGDCAAKFDFFCSPPDFNLTFFCSYFQYLTDDALHKLDFNLTFFCSQFTLHNQILILMFFHWCFQYLTAAVRALEGQRQFGLGKVLRVRMHYTIHRDENTWDESWWRRSRSTCPNVIVCIPVSIAGPTSLTTTSLFPKWVKFSLIETFLTGCLWEWFRCVEKELSVRAGSPKIPT